MPPRRGATTESDAIAGNNRGRCRAFTRSSPNLKPCPPVRHSRGCPRLAATNHQLPPLTPPADGTSKTRPQEVSDVRNAALAQSHEGARVSPGETRVQEQPPQRRLQEGRGAKKASPPPVPTSCRDKTFVRDASQPHTRPPGIGRTANANPHTDRQPHAPDDLRPRTKKGAGAQIRLPQSHLLARRDEENHQSGAAAPASERHIEPNTDGHPRSSADDRSGCQRSRRNLAAGPNTPHAAALLPVLKICSVSPSAASVTASRTQQGRPAFVASSSAAAPATANGAQPGTSTGAVLPLIVGAEKLDK